MAIRRTPIYGNRARRNLAAIKSLTIMKNPNIHEERELTVAEQQSIKGGGITLLAVIKIIEALLPVLVLILASID